MLEAVGVEVGAAVSSEGAVGELELPPPHAIARIAIDHTACVVLGKAIHFPRQNQVGGDLIRAEAGAGSEGQTCVDYTAGAVIRRSIRVPRRYR